MTKKFLVACMAASALIPASASAQQSCERQRSTRVAATDGDAAVGGVVGHQVAKPDGDCNRAFGYYDGQGRWIARPSGTNGAGSGMPREIRAREAWLERYIRSAGSEGNLSRSETYSAMRDLGSIRRSEQYMRRNRQGDLSIRDEAAINLRLDRLSSRLRIASFEDDRRY